MKLKENFVQAAKELMGTPEEQAVSGKPAQSAPEQKQPEKSERAPARMFGKAPAEPTAAATIIGEGTIFTGNMETSGPVELYGTFNGNINTKDELKIAGRLVGDASGASIEVCGCQMKGNLTAQKSIRIDGASIVIGNVNADSLVLNGKIKGDLNIAHTLVLESNAALLGNASGATISMQEGASFQGEMRITSADLTGVFKDESVG